jgi:hypothetical protein
LSEKLVHIFAAALVGVMIPMWRSDQFYFQVSVVTRLPTDFPLTGFSALMMDLR